MRILSILSSNTRNPKATSPLAADVSQASASWIIAFLVLLLSCVLIGLSSMNNVMLSWQEQFSRKMRIEVPNPHPGAIAQVLDLLRQNDSVARVDLYQGKSHGIEEQLEFLMPLPAIIDVDLNPLVPFDFSTFLKQLEQMAAQSRIETYGDWQAKLGQLIFFLETLASLLIMLIGLAVLVTVTLVTRSSLVIHRDIIETLQLMGATAPYIAQQFEIRAFRLALKGGVLGLMFVVPLIYGLAFANKFLPLPEIDSLLPSKFVLLLVVLLPLIVACFSLGIARLAVLRTLTSLD